MRLSFVTILVLVQSTSAQHVFTLRMNTDLTSPAAASNPLLPSYDTWNNAYSIGADLTVALAGPSFWALSVEYTARHYSRFRHPYGPNLHRTYGGDGRIIRGAISAGLRTQVAGRASAFAALGLEFLDARYDPVYYENGIWWEVEPGPMFDQALDPSARYVAPVGTVGVMYPVLGPLAFVLDLRIHRNRSTGIYYRSSFGLGLSF